MRYTYDRRYTQSSKLNSFTKTRYLKCLTEETVFMYSGIKFKVEVPEKTALFGLRV